MGREPGAPAVGGAAEAGAGREILPGVGGMRGDFGLRTGYLRESGGGDCGFIQWSETADERGWTQMRSEINHKDTKDTKEHKEFLEVGSVGASDRFSASPSSSGTS